MKKILKALLIIILIAIVVSAGYLAYLFFWKSEGRSIYSVVPEDAIFMVETNNLSKAWTTISNSNMWAHLVSTEYFKELDEDIQYLDDYLRDNAAIGMLLENKELLLSAHMKGALDYDFLYIVDMENVSKASKGIKETLGLIPGYKFITRNFKCKDGFRTIEIMELINENDKDDIIFMAFIDNLLLISFTGEIIESAILQKDDNYWTQNNKFQEVTAEISGQRLFSFMFSYDQLPNFYKVFLEEEDEISQMLGQALMYSAFNLFLKDDQLSLNGYTNVDTIPSYIRALAMVKPEKIRAHEILSNQTALYFSMCFDDYKAFQNNLIQQYSEGNQDDYESYQKNLKRIEKFLKIDLNEVLFDWFGNEIAFAKMRPSAMTRAEDVIVAIHAKDIIDAENGLNKFVEQLKKRTPMRFDIIEYKNYKINYLNTQKGLFNLIFGGLMKDLEKPFFTFIEDYVIMSNSEQTLKDAIDDYLKGKVLAKKTEFIEFRDNFDIKSNISLFIQMPKIYSNLYYYSAKEKRKSIQENKELILSFARIGFQLISEGNRISTKLIAEYDSTALLDDQLEQIEDETTDEMFSNIIDTLDFRVKLTENQLETDGLFKLPYPEDSTKIKATGMIKNNQVAGVWKTYYPEGRLLCTANYQDGKLNGEVTFYYRKAGQLVRAIVNYQDDKMSGVYREFYDTKVRKATLNYEEGKLKGDAEYYYPNGEVKIKGEYKNGLKDGKWFYFDQRGNEIRKEKYKNGEKKR